ncbi:MAG TPA: nucleotide exchange factor GrpE, partial [Clostridia bacterium]|nr:nucleotide exchange factor GrpE [Clostridia bacterium]
HTIAGQISGATNHWQLAQEQADKTVTSAKEIAERMNAEVKGFTEFMQHVNDREKATLKLEVEKLHRGQAEWLQVLVRMLDHIYALNQGAIQSGQQNVIQQVAQFQNACRDAARRIGLAPFVAAPEEAFDPEKHQLLDNRPQPPGDAKIINTIATGYTFQGKLLRPALVKVQDDGAPPVTETT